MSKSIMENRTNQLVTKSNILIEANYKLGVVEQKIILCLASNIHPEDSDFKSYTLPIKEFNRLLGLNGTPKYTELRQITKELMQKVFEVRIDKKVIQVAWLSYVAYNESEGTIDVRFDPFLRPYLLELKKEFTSYKLENIVKLKSSYAIRIYELLKQYERFQERTFFLSDLRKMLGAENVYPAYGNFKQRVLLPAQKELMKKTDISFEIEVAKKGRKVEKVKFLIKSAKQPKIEELDIFESNLEEFKLSNSFSKSVRKLGKTLGIQLSDEVIKSWEKYGQATVIDLLEKIQDRKDIENPIGYITKVLRSSGPNEGVASSENILMHLISDFRKSRDPLPYWFVEEKSISEIQRFLDVEQGDAVQIFEKIKQDLYETLNIMEPENTTIEKKDIEKAKIQIEDWLKGV